jgi:integrase
MNPLRVVAAGEPETWRDALAASVRDEFRVDVYVPPSDDRVLFGVACSVDRCGRPGRTYARDGIRLCHGHWRRWRDDDSPELAAWATTATPLKREAFTAKCLVETCERSAMALGLCRAHYNRARKPPHRGIADLLANPGPVPPWGQQACAMLGCEFVTHPRSRFCDRHEQSVRSRLRRLSRADAEQAMLEGAARGLPRYDLRAPSPVTRDELRFLLQAIHDELLPYRWDPGRWRQLRKLYNVTAAESLLDIDLDPEDHELLVDCSARRLRRALEAVRRQATGESGRDADVWHRELYQAFAHDSQRDTPAQMDFTRVRAPWLRALVKEVVWQRLAAGGGITPVTAWRIARGVIYFETWAGARLTGPQDITRGVLLDYLAHVQGVPVSRGERNLRLQSLKTFVETVRALELAPIPPSAGYLRHEWADRKRTETVRYFEDRELAQLDDPANRARLNPYYQRGLEVLRRTGVRISSLVRLHIDALIESDGVFYLRYLYTKTHGGPVEKTIPISAQLAAVLREQQAWVRRNFGAGCEWLFPRIQRNPSGRHHAYEGTVREVLKKWVRECRMTDTLGRPLAFKPHRFRHTLGTQMINEDVSQRAVQDYLGHDSPQMTAHYAKLKDATLRREMEAFHTRVNIKGEIVEVLPDDVSEDAVMLKERISRSKQALPNGYCGQPIQLECPHPNACLTCDAFQTDERFRPVLVDQLERSRERKAWGEQHAYGRVVEINSKDELNLVAMLDRLDRIDAVKQAGGSLRDAMSSPASASDGDRETREDAA